MKQKPSPAPVTTMMKLLTISTMTTVLLFTLMCWTRKAISSMCTRHISIQSKIMPRSVPSQLHQLHRSTRKICLVSSLPTRIVTSATTVHITIKRKRSQCTLTPIIPESPAPRKLCMTKIKKRLSLTASLLHPRPTPIGQGHRPTMSAILGRMQIHEQWPDLTNKQFNYQELSATLYFLYTNKLNPKF